MRIKGKDVTFTVRGPRPLGGGILHEWGVFNGIRIQFDPSTTPHHRDKLTSWADRIIARRKNMLGSNDNPPTAYLENGSKVWVVALDYDKQIATVEGPTLPRRAEIPMGSLHLGPPSMAVLRADLERSQRNLRICDKRLEEEQRVHRADLELLKSETLVREARENTIEYRDKRIEALEGALCHLIDHGPRVVFRGTVDPSVVVAYRFPGGEAYWTAREVAEGLLKAPF